MDSLKKDERLQQWYRDARIGLFLHWGMHTGEHKTDPFGPDFRYIYETVDAFDQAVEEAGWNAQRWVSTAVKLRAKYITLATFHCQQGYLKIWQSDVPGSRSTGRDYLREMLDAAEAEGIRIIVYINRDSKNAIHGGIEWLNKEAYRSFKKDDTVDITARDGYLAYSIEVMEELLDRYPRVAGFWFDGYHDKLEAQEVFARLHRKREDIVLINNDFSKGPVEDEDAMALEDFGKVCHPDYDWASGTWVGPGDKEFAFKAKWDWWYLGEGNAGWGGFEENYANVPDNATLVKKIVTVAGTSWNAHLGYGPKIGGEFPEVLDSFTNHFDRFMAWAEESIYGTVGGGYDQGGFPPGHWNEGAYGVTTVVPGGETHYLHVLTPPRGQLLVLQDAGYDVLAAEDLRTGELLSFKQKDGHVMIDVRSWETLHIEGDMVIKLTTAPHARIVPTALLDAKASSELPYASAVNVLNDNYESYFRGPAMRAWPQTLTLRMTPGAAEYEWMGLCVTQPETGAVLEGGYAAPIGERLKAYELHVSQDGVNWGEPIACGELHNQRGMQMIAFQPVGGATFLRLTALSNHGGTDTFQLISLRLVHV
ncbi:alpha-L-fucosidase [Paenibacillus sp. BC26]|uniref:alpha-L-fucosidase n=1 Tax=Paenibacillus sp. BC26 TaxID=1881032 RepID=UPI0008ECF589|nr:alpha-L-fucosidase [Paenibacillus sp. BC26]SFT06757.1 alpha-L-fucosidase [Paenibacillus sp. BC26]